MAQITRDEVKKIARLSHIDLSEEEIDKTMSHLEAVLAYAIRVQDIAQDVNIPNPKNRNIEREDVIISTDPEPIRAQAPEREVDFFVVPVIIESNQ